MVVTLNSAKNVQVEVGREAGYEPIRHFASIPEVFCAGPAKEEVILVWTIVGKVDRPKLDSNLQSSCEPIKQSPGSDNKRQPALGLGIFEKGCIGGRSCAYTSTRHYLFGLFGLHQVFQRSKDYESAIWKSTVT